MHKILQLVLWFANQLTEKLKVSQSDETPPDTVSPDTNEDVTPMNWVGKKEDSGAEEDMGGKEDSGGEGDMGEKQDATTENTKYACLY